MFDLGYLFTVAVLYLSTLFLIAYATDRGWLPERLVRHPAVYVLSLGVYATSWSYYGSVGLARDEGFLFLAVYLGPTLAFILTPILLRPILRLIREYQLTSLADLFAFRYSSQTVGVLVTLFALAGTLPYIALQIRAVTESIHILTDAGSTNELALAFCAILTVFAILFGTRHISPREKHRGLVVAIAFESLVKLGAILAVGLFAVFGVFQGPAQLDTWLQDNPQILEALFAPIQEAPWITLVILSFAAAFLLPRQFHMSFVENLDPHSLSYASWAFPLFLLLFNLAIPPILWAGQLLATPTPPDYYVLGITLTSPSSMLPTLAFLGGISSASAMVIVTTLALASMALNHLLLPASYPDPNVDLYRWLVWGRRMIIGIIIITSYGAYLLLEHNQGLVQLGLISFVAVVQFLPGIIGTLYWQRATRYGFIAGLVAGGAVWYTTLLMPLLQASGVTQSDFNLQEFLGATGQNLWEFSTFWSLSLNSLLFVAVSLATRQDEGEERAVAACFGNKLLTPPAGLPVAASPEDIITQLVPIIGESAAIAEVNKALKDLELPTRAHRPEDMTRLRDRIERNLSGMLGPMLARMIVYSRVQVDDSTREALADQMRFVEHQLERSRTQLRGLTRELDDLRRYHQQVLHDLPLGACAISAGGEILSWNEAMTKLTGIKAAGAIGLGVSSLSAPWAELLVSFLDQGQRHFHKQRVLVDGRPHWLNLHKAATVASPGGLISAEKTQPYQQGVVVLLEDLTEVQTLESELAHSERLASIGRLAAGVAHEIGNPLTGIASITQNLRDETEAEATQEGLADILEQIGRIDTIVKSLMTFSHGGGPDGQGQEAFDLAQCVADAERLVRLSRGDKQVSYSLALDAGLMILGDRQRMQQVVVNLLTNARDAVLTGGHVAVTLRASEDEAILSVEDDGAGIPESYLDRVFEPFFTTKQPGEGTGLGLPLAYTIVRDHGGTIRINAGNGGGTRVTLTLPLCRAAEVSIG